jgi:spore germination protein KC
MELFRALNRTWHSGNFAFGCFHPAQRSKNKLKPTITTLITTLTLSIFCCGCWGQKEINRLSIVMAAAVDLAEKTDNVDLSVQVANPAVSAAVEGGGGGADKEAFFVITGSGKTLGEAERDLYDRLPRLLYWNNMNVMVVSAKFAQQKMDSIVDYLDRPNVFRRDMRLVVTPGKAKEILTVKHLTEKMSGLAIANIQKLAFKHSKTVYPSDIHDFLLDLSDEGVDPILARLDIMPSAKTNEGQPKYDEEQKMLVLSGSAIFRNTKMVGWLNGNETRGALWVWGEMRQGMITLSYPGPKGKSKDKFITVLNQQADRNLKLEMENGKPRIKVIINAEGRLSGCNFLTRKSITDDHMIKLLDQEYKTAIENEVKNVIAITRKKEYSSDIFGFGEVIAERQPKLWRKLKPHWKEEFRKLSVTVEVEAHIRRIGLIMGSSNTL